MQNCCITSDQRLEGRFRHLVERKTGELHFNFFFFSMLAVKLLDSVNGAKQSDDGECCTVSAVRIKRNENILSFALLSSQPHFNHLNKAEKNVCCSGLHNPQYTRKKMPKVFLGLWVIRSDVPVSP